MAEIRYAGVGSAAIQKRTGRTWDDWLTLLDAAGAQAMSHQQIVTILRDQHQVGAWWQQMIAVGYEQARGKRVKHQVADGYSISRTKTMAVAAADVFVAWKDKRRRRRWLADVDVTIRTATPYKRVRITWIDGTSSVEVLLCEKGAAKTQVTVQHSRLGSAREAATMKAYWGEQLHKLQVLLTSSA